MNPKSCFIIIYVLTNFNRLKLIWMWAASDRAGVSKTIKGKFIYYNFIERGTSGLILHLTAPSTTINYKAESC